jgi:hypothetical protein
MFVGKMVHELPSEEFGQLLRAVLTGNIVSHSAGRFHLEQNGAGPALRTKTCFGRWLRLDSVAISGLLKRDRK